MNQVRLSEVERLLDRELTAEYRREWTEIIAAENSLAEAGTKSIFVFRIGCEWLALPTKVFQEVAEGCRVHKLPHRNNGVVRGIMNVRGEILLCAALDVLLGTGAAPESGEARVDRSQDRVLVCNRNGDRMAFTVDDVHGVHHYLPGELKQLPATAAKSANVYTLGLLPWKNNQTIACLDDELVFYGFNKSLS